MTNPAFTGPQRIMGDFASDKTETPASKPVEERLQKLLDKALYANGSSSAQKIRNFLNGTWFVVDRESSRWQKRARISVGHFLKVNWSVTVLNVHITPLDLPLTMA